MPSDECSCAETNPAASEPGVLRTAIDERARSLTIDYDPSQLSDESVRRIVLSMESQARRHFEKCLLRLKGRASEACALNFERKAERIQGIRRATATFIGGTMTVTFDEATISPREVLESVRRTGAPVEPIEQPPPAIGLAAWFHGLRLELLCTIATALFMVAGWAGHQFGIMPHALANLCYVAAYAAGGIFGVRAGLLSLRNGTIDVDLLMVLAALGAAIIDHPFEGSMLLFLFSLSNVLQGFAMERTRRAIQSLMKLRPAQALVKRGDEFVLRPVEELAVGDVIIVRPGESIPLDALIVEGESAIDESSLTGESMPVSKKAGDPIYAATINQSGSIEARVTRLARDSAIEKLIRAVEEAQSEKASTQRFLDKAEQYYAAGVILFTIGLIIGPLLAGKPFAETFYRAMTVMVVASPCALIISTPASILSAIGCGARRGILFKGGVHLERTASIRIVALDKTGTLTEGRPRVTDIVPHGLDADRLLQLAASVESRSEHPLARAVVAEARARNLSYPDCKEFQSTSGKGASGVVEGRRIAVGSPRFFATSVPDLPADLQSRIDALHDAGKTCILVGERNEDEARILGAIAIADVLRATAPLMIRQLKALGVERVVMLTGDNQRVAAAIAAEAGVDEFHAELLPGEKVRLVKALGDTGPVAMVGDGVNDAPALATATIGIAMGAAGTDVAMETADLVLMGDNLMNIPFAIALSRQARRVVRQNLTFAFGVIICLVASALGLGLPLPLGVVGHEGSTVLVCLNGLRLLVYKGPDVSP